MQLMSFIGTKEGGSLPNALIYCSRIIVIGNDVDEQSHVACIGIPLINYVKYIGFRLTDIVWRGQHIKNIKYITYNRAY